MTKSTLFVLGAFFAFPACNFFTGDDSRSPQPATEDISDAATEPAPDAETEPAATPDAESPSPPKIDEVTEAFGIFVSPTGTSAGEGTRDKPLSSIAAGIAMAKAAKKRVYVCQGTYKESLALEDKVSVIGGFECSKVWAASDAGRSRIESPTSPALRAEDIVTPTTFAGFDVLAPKGTPASPSSIGLIAHNAKSLTIAKSSITASDAADGTPGVEGKAPDPGTKIDGSNGTPSDSNDNNRKWGGVSGGTSTCGGGAGGHGGEGAVYECTTGCHLEGTLFLCPPSYPSRCTRFFPLNLTTPCGTTNPESKTGAVGTNGTDGASASVIGSLSQAGYEPANGTAGSSGHPGEGGSGGTAESLPKECRSPGTTAYGPGGGAGGCGGVSGTPGTGGGASIGALLLSSEGMTFDAAVMVAGAGGAGGEGTLGAPPTVGGMPGTSPTGAGPGQPGGRGGRPGVSGSGAGGPSFGIAYTTGAPTLIHDASAKAGKGGAGGVARSKTFQDMTWSLSASTAGTTEDLHEFWMF